ncbi:hypothetical protein ATE92_2703 [Ulvibacter sp. MAR_2010_11]|nr:hypothetical protein ATE92_2703 [Ulvibacter sp. MAR_2010_11]
MATKIIVRSKRYYDISHFNLFEAKMESKNVILFKIFKSGMEYRKLELKIGWLLFAKKTCNLSCRSLRSNLKQTYCLINFFVAIVVVPSIMLS